MMGKTQKLLSENVTLKRNKLRLTQENLAEISDLSKRMIQKIEYQQAWPGPETLDSLADALQCEPWELISDSERTNSAGKALADMLEKMNAQYQKIGELVMKNSNLLRELEELQSQYEKLKANTTNFLTDAQRELLFEVRNNDLAKVMAALREARERGSLATTSGVGTGTKRGS